MFDYDRLANLFVCLVLLGLFVIVDSIWKWCCQHSDGSLTT